MNSSVHGKTMENLRNITDAKLVSYKRHYLKWTSKPSYMSHIQKYLTVILLQFVKAKLH